MYNIRDIVELKDGRHVEICYDYNGRHESHKIHGFDGVDDHDYGVYERSLDHSDDVFSNIRKEDIVKHVRKYDSLNDCLTVEELIIRLQSMPKNAFVVLDYGDGHGIKGIKAVDEVNIVKDYHAERYGSHDYFGKTSDFDNDNFVIEDNKLKVLSTRTIKQYERERIGKEYDIVPGVKIGVYPMYSVGEFTSDYVFEFEENTLYLWFDSEKKVLTAETKDFYLQTPLCSHLDDLHTFSHTTWCGIGCKVLILFSVLDKPDDLHEVYFDLPMILKQMDIDLDFSEYSATYLDQYMSLSEDNAHKNENLDEIYLFERRYSENFQSDILVIIDRTDATQKALYFICDEKYIEKYTTIRGRRNRDYVAGKIMELMDEKKG